MPQAVFVIWWVTLAIAVVVVLPLAWVLLHRLWLAARRIERHAAETLLAGAGIATHTGAVGALDTTVQVAGDLLRGASAVATSAEAIEGALSRGRLGGGAS